MKKLFILICMIFYAISLESCKTIDPIIIKKIPVADVSDDMTIEQYMRSSSIFAVEITAYVKDLINQIKNKVPYIDLRK